MDLQAYYWLFAAVVAAITIYNFVIGFGRRAGATEAQLVHNEINEKNWSVRFDALANALSLHQSHTSERFEKVVEKLNDALLVMAREHPTKADLNQVKHEILDRIDAQQFIEPPIARRRTPKGQD